MSKYKWIAESMSCLLVNMKKFKFSVETWICLMLFMFSLISLIIWFGLYNISFEESITGVAYKAYSSKLNWLLYPAFFLLMILLLHLARDSFLNAWKGLAETDVLKKNGKKPEPKSLKGLIHRIHRLRWRICMPISIFLALICNGLDMKNIYGVYYSPSSYQQQMQYACKEPDFFSKWLFDGWEERHHSGPPACIKQTKENGLEGWKIDSDSIDKQGAVLPSSDQKNLFWALYFQQFAIITLAFFVLTQILMHAILFGRFNSWGYAKSQGFKVELNYRSPMNEFGLEHWNQALNNMYWALSLGLIIPILSRQSQPNPNSLDDGQQILRVGISMLLLLPMITNIISRQVHLPRVWEKLKKDGNDDAEQYHHQRLWPLDRNWSSKLGIIVAFVLASLFLGIELKSIMKL